MQFGKDGCSTIEVEPISPICSFPELDGTTPLTLDVPTPTVLLPVMPNECVCFDFVSDESDVKILDSCETGKTAKCSVGIAQDGDCCDGRYKIVSNVEIPCMPFDVNMAYVHVHNKDGGDNVDGSATFSLNKECCSLTPVLDLTLPKCIKRYEIPPLRQIEYLDHGVKKTHQLVSLKRDDEECTIYPIIHELDLPCPEADYEIVYNAPLSTLGGSFKVKEGLKECVPYVEYDITPVEIPDPIPPCLHPTDICLYVKYTDSNDEEHYKKNTIELKVDDTNPCPAYITAKDCNPEAPDPPTSGLPIVDIGKLPIPGFSNGGSVNITKIGGGGGGGGGGLNLQINGDKTKDMDTIYGGGCGDHNVNTEAACLKTWRRGSAMREEGTKKSPGIIDNTYTSVTMTWGEHQNIRRGGPSESETVGDVFVKPSEKDPATAQIWTSGRFDEEEEVTTASAAASDETASSDEEEEEEEGWNWSAQANLNIIWPTGAQWHTNGIALTLTEFEFNASGILSHAKDKKQALLVSPSPAIRISDAKNLNASGLRIFADTEGDIGERDCDKVEHGLRVDAGDGLRIYGLDDGSVAKDDVDNNRQGVLEIMYGPGFRIRDVTDPTSGNPTYLNKPVNVPGALIPNPGRGIRVHVKEQLDDGETLDTKHANKIEIHGNSKDFGFNDNGKMFLNDKKAESHNVIQLTGGKLTLVPAWKNTNKDIAIPIAILDKENIDFWGALTNNWIHLEKTDAWNDIELGGTWQDFASTVYDYLSLVNTVLQGFGAMCLHITESGTVLGVNVDESNPGDGNRNIKTSKTS